SLLHAKSRGPVFRLIGRGVTVGGEFPIVLPNGPKRTRVPATPPRPRLQHRLSSAQRRRAGERDVCRLQIAMGDAFLVRRFERLRDLFGNGEPLMGTECAPRLRRSASVPPSIRVMPFAQPKDSE